MTALPYVIVVLFAMSDGSVVAMNTWQSFASPLSCAMQAFLENETANQRTYVCVMRERAVALTGGRVGLARR